MSGIEQPPSEIEASTQSAKKLAPYQIEIKEGIDQAVKQHEEEALVLAAKREKSSDKVVEFENIVVLGMEMALSKNISEPIDYKQALKWCAREGGRLPTIKELQALYDEGGSIKDSFEGKTIWSSDEFYGDVKVFDFSTGKTPIRSKTEKIASNIVNTANARSVNVAN